MKFLVYAACAAAAAAGAAVYELDSHNVQHGAVSVDSAALYLAEKIGVGSHYKIGDNHEAVALLNAHTASPKPKLVVFVEGIDEPASFLDTPAFTVEDDLAEEVSNMLSYSDRSAYGMGGVVLAFGGLNSLEQHFDQFDRKLMGTWRTFSQLAHLGVVNDETFIGEMAHIVHLASIPESDAAAVRLSGLHSLARRLGVDLETYANAQRAVADVLLSLNRVYSVSVVAMSSSEHAIENLTSKRLEFGEVFRQFRRDAQGCFKSEEACTSATNNCSLHGLCKASGKCWLCVCAPTFNKTTSKTTRWVGVECSTKDIAAQTHLLLWTLVALIVTVGMGIKLMAGIGDTPLPGVLDAGVARKD